MTTVLYPHPAVDISGGERSLLALWSRLDPARFRPVALLPGEGPFAVAARAAGVAVVTAPVPSWRSGNMLGLFRSRRRWISILSGERAAIIHAYGPRLSLMSVWAARTAGCGVVWHERNIPVLGEPDITRWLLSLPDAVVCNSRAVAGRFPAKEHVRVIHNGVDASRFLAPSAGEDPRAPLGLPPGPLVGVAANLSPRKGVEVFLEAMAVVAARVPEASFLVVGGAYGPASAGREVFLRRRAAALGLAGRMTWAGFRDDPAPWLRALDVLCHPTRQEACPRAVLEAMACGRPVAGFNDGGMPELVLEGKTGFLVRPGDVDALGEAVVRLLADPGRREEMGQAGRDRVISSFTVESNARSTMALYEEIVSRRRPHASGD